MQNKKTQNRMKKIKFSIIALFVLFNFSGISQQISKDTNNVYINQWKYVDYSYPYGDFMTEKVLQRLQQPLLTTTTGTATISIPTVTVATTYSYVTSSGTNTITTGTKLVSICNVGSDSSRFNGKKLPSGACVTLPEVIGILHPQVTYDCLNSILTVIIER